MGKRKTWISSKTVNTAEVGIATDDDGVSFIYIGDLEMDTAQARVMVKLIAEAIGKADAANALVKVTGL